MKIEPCPVCGAEVGEFYDTCGLFFYKCSKCSYRIGRHDVDAHNHLSLIVRAADAVAKAETVVEIYHSHQALKEAVERGRSDETPTASPPD